MQFRTKQVFPAFWSSDRRSTVLPLSENYLSVLPYTSARLAHTRKHSFRFSPRNAIDRQILFACPEAFVQSKHSERFILHWYFHSSPFPIILDDCIILYSLRYLSFAGTGWTFFRDRHTWLQSKGMSCSAEYRFCAERTVQSDRREYQSHHENNYFAIPYRPFSQKNCK